MRRPVGAAPAWRGHRAGRVRRTGGTGGTGHGRRVRFAAAALAVLACAAGCSAGRGRPAAPAAAGSPAPPASADPSSAAPAPGTTPPAEPSRGGHVLPSLTGDDLQHAEDRAQAAGYPYVEPYDAAGRGRVQIVYGNWRVCAQDPPPGPVSRETRIRLGVVRVSEACPAAPVPTAPPRPVDGVMPDVTGRSVNVVKTGFRGAATVEAHDLRGRRPVLIENHWRVCTQNPPAGQPVGGHVDLGVVTFDETCP